MIFISFYVFFLDQNKKTVMDYKFSKLPGSFVPVFIVKILKSISRSIC